MDLTERISIFHKDFSFEKRTKFMHRLSMLSRFINRFRRENLSGKVGSKPKRSQCVVRVTVFRLNVFTDFQMLSQFNGRDNVLSITMMRR